MSRFKGKINWQDNTYLSAVHLKEENKYFNEIYSNFTYIINNYSHVEKIKINETLLSRGILEVNFFKGMLENFQWIEYDSEMYLSINQNGEKTKKIYEIKEDINKYIRIINNEGLIFCLSLCEEEEVIASEYLEDEVYIEKILNKLRIIPFHEIKNNKYIPICKIISNSGNFFLDENYIPPTCKISKNTYLYNYLESNIKILRKKSLELSAEFFTVNKNTEVELLIEKINYSLQYNSIMPEIFIIESLINNNSHPINVFLSLQKIIGSLSLLKFNSLPNLQNYNHQDIFTVLDNSMNIIINIITSFKINGEHINFIFKNDIYSCNIDIEKITKNHKTYLLIEMENEKDRENAIKWIEEAKICGESFLPNVINKRIRGMERNILNTFVLGNKILIVEIKINMDFLFKDENLSIQNTYHLNYLPKNIIFCLKNNTF